MPPKTTPKRPKNEQKNKTKKEQKKEPKKRHIDEKISTKPDSAVNGKRRLKTLFVMKAYSACISAFYAVKRYVFWTHIQNIFENIKTSQKISYFLLLLALLAALGPLLAALGRSWAALGRSWAALGRSWTALGRSWAALGPLLGALGPLLGALGPLLAALGTTCKNHPKIDAQNDRFGPPK